jgi:O-antigen ligase
VCLNVAGLLATQSRGAVLAVACGCLLVPARRFRELAVPLLAGLALGVAAIASSPGNDAVPWLAAVLVLGVAVAAASRPRNLPRWVTTHIRTFVCVAGVVAAIGATFLVHHEIGLRVFAPSDQDRAAEWSSGLHQWFAAPLVGVGSDRLLEVHASDGSSAHFVHNEYLQVAADAGLVGLGLLGMVAVSLARALGRRGPLSSCAVAAVVCWAVGGAFDFSWHLPVVGLVGGWCAGLAVRGE